MGTYNGQHYAPLQLASILAQTRLPDELVICEDGSTDDTPALVEAFARTAPFVVNFVRNEHNLGVHKNYEKAISLCTGDVIVIADQDNTWMPEKLALTEAAYQNDPAAHLALCDALIVDDDLRPTGRTLWQNLRLTPALQKRMVNGESAHAATKVNVGWGVILSFRADGLRWVTPLLPDAHVMLYDEWAATILAYVSRVALIPQPLVKYRQHKNMYSGANSLPVGQRVVGAIFEGPKNKRGQRYGKRARKYEMLVERLRQVPEGEFPEKQAKLSMMQAKIGHLKRRAAFPAPRLARVPGALRELVGLHYHRYAEGWVGFFKDVLERDR
jgi:glycosyltransferase involved in cell wall biosynthesis